MLADDYVSMHKRIFDQYEYQPSYSMPNINVSDDVVACQSRGFQLENRSNGLRDSDKFCQYCHRRGHWKADCYVLKSKPKCKVLWL